MSLLACLIAVLPAHAALPEDPAQAAPPKPHAQLFSKALVVGHEISDGTGLEKELGAPGSLADVVQAALLFPPQAVVDRRVFATTNVAAQQIQAALDAKATIVIALDYLVPYVYGAQLGDDARTQQVAAALKALERLACPIIIGDVPDLRWALALEQPTLAAGQVPSEAALKALNDSVVAWAAARKDTVVAPVAGVFAHVVKNEPFVIRKVSWPQAWLPELMQSDRVHTRLHGTIALWLAAQDALCTARPDLDPAAFDWNPLSIYRKVYDAKSRQRDEALAKEVARLKLPPSRPPPRPPPPQPPADEESKQRERKQQDQDAERAEEDEESGGGG